MYQDRGAQSAAALGPLPSDPLAPPAYSAPHGPTRFPEPPFLSRPGGRALRNPRSGERVSLRHGSNDLDVIGISCSHKPFIDGPKLRALLPAPAERLTILLYHSPDLAPEAAALGIDLQLPGHTHGGHVRLPFFGALYASSLYGKRGEVGLRRIAGLALCVTRGLGMEGKGVPRVRFLSRPELTLWEISSEQAPGLRALAAQPEGLAHGP